jgi:hypothetical protein
MFMCGLGTIFAVVVMYIHSLGELGRHPPRWLLRVLCVAKTNSRWYNSWYKQSKNDSFVDNADEHINCQLVSVSALRWALLYPLWLQLLLHSLCALRTDVMAIAQHVRDVGAFDDTSDLWMRVCFRIDVILLIVFNVANTLLLYIYVS